MTDDANSYQRFFQLASFSDGVFAASASSERSLSVAVRKVAMNVPCSITPLHSEIRMRASVSISQNQIIVFAPWCLGRLVAAAPPHPLAKQGPKEITP